MRLPCVKFLLVLFGIGALSLACAPIPVAPPAARYKFHVSADGIYQVTSASLRNAGAQFDRIDLTTLQLFIGDTEVAIRVLGNEQDWTIEFYGVASTSPYSAHTVYWLTWGQAQGKRMREISATPPTTAPKETFQDTLHLTKPTLFIPQVGETETHWFWQSLVAPTTTTITLTLAAATPAQTFVRADFWASTQDVAQPDHHLRLLFNHTPIADETWDGQGARAITGVIPPNVVRDGENTLRIVAPGDTRAQADIVLLNSITVTYTRRFAARGNALYFTGDAGTYRATEFGEDTITLFDITDPQQPTHISNLTIAGRTLSFHNDTPGQRRWLALTPSARKSVAQILPMPATTLRAKTNQADYIVITHPDFVEAIRPLAQHREQQGFKTRIVTTTEIYDEFGFGVASPVAIRSFIEWTHQHWLKPAPRHVLLVGKASYDYRDYLNAPNKNLVPTFLVHTTNLGQAGSDNRFVALDPNSIRPALSIGRLPAKTLEQVALAVKKTIGYETGSSADWHRNAVFVADSKEGQFVVSSDALANKMLATIQAQKIYLADYKNDVAKARAELITRWNAGALMLTYIGHGSIDTWAEGPLFSTEHTRDIRNGDRLPVLFTPTCLDGFFYHPQKDSLAEALLFKNDGGIVAGLVPTGLSFPAAQDELMFALFEELFVHNAPTLGDAITRAKQKIRDDSPDLREVIETFVLLGDPALRLAGRK